MKPLPSWLTSVSELFGLSGDEAECYVCVWYVPPNACVLKTCSPAGGSILWEVIVSWGLLFHRCINPLMDSYNGIIGSWWYLRSDQRKIVGKICPVLSIFLSHPLLPGWHETSNYVAPYPSTRLLAQKQQPNDSGQKFLTLQVRRSLSSF